ncbi:MAG: asparagine synthase (glutamine-hydrolyzing) [Ignavibacteria bacterium]|jgi:asparagine synthase (glutamine-hydrolysing)|nr:asparagine synthase (glutamine-hydrolyzing) [Ignavibacteria bacterium]MCU7502555.1 asparagine synthase (glutamine-hydrolyzing) [Ignavibacteria bacterium]MCU7515242.1 asparagine synthase (glutamine-hydrolyzing) [Ignavibacteria bacterium]
MCGIAGLLNYRNTVDLKELDLFTDSLAHRGPDGRGTFTDRNLGLGHRRLSILDISEKGKCPMPYGGEDGRRYWITYNGEVYNFLELKKELSALGYRFQSETDTEVILASYIEWGSNCLYKFNGMWAFAIWDCIERKLFLSRDRFGVKPLYFYFDGERFAFASEIKSFPVLAGFQPAMNESLIPKIISNSYSYEGTNTETIMKGVYRLPGGHNLTVKEDGSYNVSKWWDTKEHLVSVPSGYSGQVEGFKELFMDSVRLRTRSDVPIGTCLSGGIDSSAVASSLAWNYKNNVNGMDRATSQWQNVFIAEFPGSAIDEKKYADIVVNSIGSPAYYSTFNDSYLDNIVDTVWATEDVYGGLALPVWFIYKSLRKKNIVVSLDGHGADELLGGYTWYLDTPANQLNDKLYEDFHYTLLPAILRNFDRNSMAHGVEVRMPFMDHRLVSYAFSLPAEAKVGGGFTKRIVRDSMKGIVSEKILNRRSKIGFNSPMIELFNGRMQKLIDVVLNHPLWLESPYWNGRKLKAHVMEKTRSRAWSMKDWGETLQIWTFMNVVIWHMLFVERKTDLN